MWTDNTERDTLSSPEHEMLKCTRFHVRREEKRREREIMDAFCLMCFSVAVFAEMYFIDSAKAKAPPNSRDWGQTGDLLYSSFVWFLPFCYQSFGHKNLLCLFSCCIILFTINSKSFPSGTGRGTACKIATGL